MMHPHANAVLQQLKRDCELTSLLAEIDRLGFAFIGTAISGTAEQWAALKERMYGTALPGRACHGAAARGGAWLCAAKQTKEIT